MSAYTTLAGSVEPREGWAVHETNMEYRALLDSLKQAVKESGMAVVTEAGPIRPAGAGAG